MIVCIEVHNSQSQNAGNHDTVASGDQHFSQFMAQQTFYLGHDIRLDLFRDRCHLFFPGKGIFFADIQGDQQVGYHLPHSLHNEKQDKIVECHQHIDLQSILYQIRNKIDGIRDIIHHVRVEQRFLICQEVRAQAIRQKQDINQVNAVRNLHIPHQYRQKQSDDHADSKHHPRDHNVAFFIKMQ